MCRIFNVYMHYVFHPVDLVCLHAFEICCFSHPQLAQKRINIYYLTQTPTCKKAVSYSSAFFFSLSCIFQVIFDVSYIITFISCCILWKLSPFRNTKLAEICNLFFPKMRFLLISKTNRCLIFNKNIFQYFQPQIL